MTNVPDDRLGHLCEMAGSEPLVTVLLPSIRIDSWLKRALESILNDGYPRIEVILLLDGIEEFPSQSWLHDSRVTIVPLGQRVGIAQALNIGLDIARSEFVARMDSDDVSLRGRLRAQVNFLLSNDRVAVVGCQAIRMDEQEVPIGPLDAPIGDVAIKKRLLLRNSMIHPTIMFRRSAVHEVGGYSLTARNCEDYDLYLRLASKHELANLADCYLQYRLHSGQVSRGFNPFSLDALSLVRRRQHLAGTLERPIVVQVVRDAFWYMGQVSRYLGLRKRPWGM